jgi:hypothetical protein
LGEPVVPVVISMILRLSQKLGTKIKAGTLNAMPLDENPYADWSCHLFTVDRTQYILVSNTQSLYSCMLYGKGVTNDRIFSERVLTCLRDRMAHDGQAFTFETYIATSSVTVSFAKALNRSVTGSMNDLIGHTTAWLEYGEIAPHDLGFRLNDIPLSAIAWGPSGRYGKPNEAFRRLADVYERNAVC